MSDGSSPAASAASDPGRRADAIFLAALERPAAEWSAYLEGACGGDDALRHSVLSLLRAHQKTGPLDRLGERLPGLATRSGAAGASPASAPPPGFPPGTRLGRYEIRERLGFGGMGEVFRAFDTRLEREVAIKRVARRLEGRPEALSRFEAEARAASALNHPNIVAVHDIGEHDDHPYIVMELVEGESLRDHIEAALPVERVVRLAGQLAGGLAAAHERGVVHRDLKPENVVVTPQGVAKILDFGLARIQPVEVASEDSETLPAPPAEAVVGTVGYMSPEALTGRRVDHRTDQFALGAILYEMASGRRCFQRASTAETLVATLHEEPEALGELRRDLPPALLRVVERCLAKDPAGRYASTWALHKALSTVSVEAPRIRTRAALPPVAHRLVGRDGELHRIQNLAIEARVRLITLTGAGGSGKTRLAIEAARSLQPAFPGGVFYVSLATVREAERVAPTIGWALGGVESPGGSDLPALVLELSAERGPVLLVLDNFEQVVDAASLVGELLTACPELSVLITSREVLRLSAEHELPVPPLALPQAIDDLESVGRAPAVQLFLDRARATAPEFALTRENAPAVAELCARLDGLPLALELAAGRVRTLTPAAMLERLGNRLALLTRGPRDLPERQRTLRQTIAWSHELLDPAEQDAFARLGVFEGSFTLEAAEAVMDPFGRLDRSADEIVDSLLEKSLLVRSAEGAADPRFRLLETIREFALERLGDGEAGAEARRAHAAYFSVLAQDLEAAGRGQLLTGLAGRAVADWDNYQAALDWAISNDSAQWGFRVALALHPFWEHGEQVAEGRRRLSELLALPSAEEPRTRARITWLLGALARVVGDHAESVSLMRDAYERFRTLRQGREATPRDRFDEATSLGNVAVHLVDAGRLDEARLVFEECLVAWKELGDPVTYGRNLSNYARCLRRSGDLDEARARYREAASVFARAGDRAGAAWEASHEGDLATLQNDLGAAETLYRHALSEFQELDDDWGVTCSLVDLGDVARLSGAIASARRHYRQALPRMAGARHRRGLARVVESLAVLAQDEGRSEHALALAAAAAAQRRLVRSATPQELEEPLARAVGAARAALGPEAASEAWGRGARLSLDGMIRLAAESAADQAEA